MGRTRGDGLLKLREELEAENSGVHILAKIRWLGAAKVQARFQTCKEGTSSVVAAVSATGPLVASARVDSDYSDADTRPTPLRRPGGQTFFVDDAAGGDISPALPGRNPPRCTLCAKDHLTTDHQCLVEGCRTGRGHQYPHGQQSAPTAEGPTGRGRMPVSTREGSASPPGCRSHHPPHAGRGGRRRLWGLPRLGLPR